jgi:hypothetical protein
VQVAGFRVHGSGFRVPGAGFKASDIGLRVWGAEFGGDGI